MNDDEKTVQSEFKASGSFEAIRARKTLSQLGSQFKVHPDPDCQVEESALDNCPELFWTGGRARGRNGRKRTATRCMKRWAAEVELTGSKKSRDARLSRCGRWWSGTNQVCGGNASLLGVTARVVLRAGGGERGELLLSDC